MLYYYVILKPGSDLGALSSILCRLALCRLAGGVSIFVTPCAIVYTIEYTTIPLYVNRLMLRSRKIDLLFFALYVSRFVPVFPNVAKMWRENEYVR